MLRGYSEGRYFERKREHPQVGTENRYIVVFRALSSTPFPSSTDRGWRHELYLQGDWDLREFIDAARR
jgi:hypothetical protein